MNLSINNKWCFKPVALIFVLLACYSYSYGQPQITGKVINHDNKAPIANANVFLNNATVGGKTEADGSFTLKNVKAGKYELIVSIVGYETYRQIVVAANADINLPDIIIFPKVIALKEVTVRPVNDAERNRNYQWFKQQFLGSSGLAEDCAIKNPELLDLDFNDTTAVLTASSADFLQIENQALGYSLKYLLTDFSYNTLGTHALHYEGSVLFENMKGTASQEARWKKKRLAVYQPSQMHFLRALLNNRLDEEGFRVLQCLEYPNPQRPDEHIVDQKVSHFRNQKPFNFKTRDSLAYWEKKQRLPKMLLKLMGYPMSQDEILKVTDQKNIYALGCDMDALHITYNKNRHFPKKATLYDLDDPYNRETTLLHFKKLYAFFYNSGGLVDVNSVSYTGGWGNSRVAELLPVDYEPSVTEEIETKDIHLNAVAVVQPGPLKDSLLKITAASDSSIKNQPAEKLYVQLDKPYYAIGDTIWFKAYLINAPTMGLSTKSGILHIDISNDSNTYTKHYKYEVKDGLSWGNIGLDKFPPGNYAIRAYTSWMRNFDNGGFFYKQFTVTDGKDQTWMANEQVTTSVANGQLNARVKLQLSDVNKTPITYKDLQLEVMMANKHLYKQQLQTDKNGALDVNFTVPEKTADLKLVATDKQGANKITIPVNLNRADKIDIQFLPEGGSLVAGLSARVGFKAIGEDGKGVKLSGIVVDANKQQVASFQTLHNGMGSFDMAVKPGENYGAQVNLPGGLVKAYSLPAVKSSGTRLNVINPADKDSVTLSVAATKDLAQSGTNYFLVGKARGVVCYAAIVNFKEGANISRRIAKNLFPTGITHFILMTTNGRPLNERLVFIDHHDDLQIEVEPDQAVYAPKDSVALRFRVKDRAGEPVAGNFSMAVTEDKLVKTDSISNNILTHLLLTSDLKGYVEEPGYYFQKHANTWQALDNLLLTQGWVSYDWQRDKGHPVYETENGFAIAGQVSNAFNKPLSEIKIDLLSKSPFFVKDTITNKAGRFTFINLPRVDTPAFFLKTGNRSFNVGIKIDESAPPVFDAQFPVKQPWYVNSDTTLIKYTRNRDSINLQRDYYTSGGHHLREVKILAKKIVKGSQNLNGPGNADMVLDEKDMEQAGKKTWLDIFHEKIKGFKEGTFIGTTKNDIGFILFLHDVTILDAVVPNGIERISTFRSPWYFVDDKPVKFVVDGISLGKVSFYGVGFTDVKYYLKSHNAEEIKGIEINSSTKYASKYIPAQFAIAVPFSSVAFIEITTRSGHGPFLQQSPAGTYLYKPLPISYPAQFYKPKYALNDTTKHQHDLRSTIDWEPNIITDKNGNATVSFYASDKPGAYSLIMEGTDGNGNLGYKRVKITINKKKQTK